MKGVPMIFSHNDVNLTNIILTGSADSEPSLELIDYEFGCYNYLGFDLGNFYNEFQTEYSETSFKIHEEWKISEKLEETATHLYFS